MSAPTTGTPAGSDGSAVPPALPGVRIDVPVRWSDMDAYGHVNHSRTVTILEEARVETVFKPGSPSGTLGAGAVVAELQVSYRRQLVHDDSPLQVLMWVSRLRAADFTLCYELRPRGEDESTRPAVTASTQIVAFDIAAQRPRRLSEVERATLQQWRRE
ncbi:thioesterase family protein [Rhodococcus sp. X156]|uniref:acyl-CoA thioesterase n=1 Tax=Rhodococcus sp. X156 TaxID=2499145 RepID=UPI000FDB3615|nr:thioesterase family protein [Rhodococcus sp. X156]